MATKINKIIVTLFLVLLPCVSIAEVLVAGLSCDAKDASTEPQKHYLLLYKLNATATNYRTMCLDEISNSALNSWNCITGGYNRVYITTDVDQIRAEKINTYSWTLDRKTLKFSTPETYQCQLEADPAAIKARVETLKAKQLEGNQL